mmetsp:Transcript_37153/g.54656  ORF Transcript_37153/g.54656 Transcript_37153/m.54656 type:complete len:215 (+) Transcript_37153:87-731(+)|eukprot:CAMPEP_0195519190 /NCGR_PEP_ID=MMETSP0794_2-20130614/14507_1 /TAXON_ID=515487 /ORGANISM="Stephanopyxis turris, Strain CCMP 815" /LENGTH=214 /DNA_ID=CAMNT_0040648305 /DNA_START=85 /DNA_END=729 /DNA_ORIENTATION=+
MTIVSTEDKRNSAWANDKSAFGQRMLRKMGWTDGNGLGKEQQGAVTHLRGVRRSEEALGIGAETDLHGSSGWTESRNNFQSVLATLQATHAVSNSSDSSSDSSSKKSKKSKKKKREKNSLTLAQNKVAAGHAAKMRSAKDLSTKTNEDMAAIFGMKVTEYAPIKAISAGDSTAEKKKKKKSKKRSRDNTSEDNDQGDLKEKKSKKKKKKRKIRD